jgi:hypothetical protein
VSGCICIFVTPRSVEGDPGPNLVWFAEPVVLRQFAGLFHNQVETQRLDLPWHSPDASIKRLDLQIVEKDLPLQISARNLTIHLSLTSWRRIAEALRIVSHRPGWLYADEKIDPRLMSELNWIIHSDANGLPGLPLPHPE